MFWRLRWAWGVKFDRANARRTLCLLGIMCCVLALAIVQKAFGWQDPLLSIGLVAAGGLGVLAACLIAWDALRIAWRWRKEDL